MNFARDCLIARGHQGESVRKGVRASISPSEEIVEENNRGWVRVLKCTGLLMIVSGLPLIVAVTVTVNGPDLC